MLHKSFVGEHKHSGVLFFPFYNQSLRALIIESIDVMTNVEKLWSYAVGIISGLNHLHTYGFVHSDIKPANVLIDKGKVIIIDFGAAIKIGDPIIEYTASYSLGLHNYPASPHLDWVCTAVTLYVCHTSNFHIISIDELIVDSKRLNNKIGDLIVRLCLEKEALIEDL